MASIYLTQDGTGYDSPVNGRPYPLASLFRDLRDDGLINVYGCEMGAGRRLSPAALTAASTTLRIVSRSPLKFGQITAAYGAGTSSGIDWPSLSNHALQAAVNSIAGVAALGGVDVTGGNGRYLVTWRKAGAVSHVTVSGLGAVPDVYSRTSTVTAGDSVTRAVQLIEIEPAAIQLFDTDDWTAITAPTLSATVTAGTSASHEITAIRFDKPPAGGTWTASDGVWRTDAISVFASASQVESALNAAAGGSPFRVRKSGAFAWEALRIVINNQPDLTVEDAGVIPHVGVYGLTDWRAIQKYGFAGEPTVKARALARVTFADGRVLDLAEDIEISLDSAPAVASVLTSTATPSNVVGTYPATESISASRFVQIYDASGTDSIRAGSAANSYDADGFIIEAVESGGTVTVYGTTGTLSGLSGLTTGYTQYLGEAGAVTQSAPVAGIRQDLGEAISDGRMTVNIQPPVIL